MVDLQQLGVTPIGSEDPAGSNARESEAYLALQAEIAKLSIASAEPQEIDWRHVVEQATIVLSTQSKDILAAVYLCEGLIQTQQMEGLALGTQILADLLEHFWDRLFPPKKRMRGRLSAIEWWHDRVDRFLGGYQGPTIPAETADAVTAALQALDGQIESHFEDGPILKRLLNAFRALPREEAPPPASEPEPTTPPEPSPEPAPTEASQRSPTQARQTTPASSSATPSSAPPAKTAPVIASEIPTDASEGSLLQTAYEHLSQLAETLFACNPRNPLSYRLRRLAAWSRVQAQPPANAGKTLIPDPDSSVIESLQTMLANQAGLDLVRAAESRIGQYVFWIDLSFMTARGLESLGSDYQAAARTVALETRVFVERLPGVDGLAFNEGQPFASQEAQIWLREISGTPTASDTASVGAESRTDGVRETLLQARKQAREQGLGEGLGLLREALHGCGTGKERFLLKTGLLALLAMGGKAELAAPLARQILDEVTGRDLGSWDPQLATEGLAAAWQALMGSHDEETSTLARQIRDRIAALDPAAALALTS